ncbi:carboxypeptidase M32 [Neobacillus notoginsengisoli]|uniref:Metal-dependent carboxypeptidase n=2 Tax=Neobacillus notoginsengisoli TaxID=1578198 RepID=A0A417YSF9_9BACI|nr:carboxypeptidase M32 [Neobacillus notoginsengisoli]
MKEFKELDEKITHFDAITGLADWDQKVMAPKKGRNEFAKAVGTLRTEAFKLAVSEEMGNLLKEFNSESAREKLDEVTAAQVRERQEFYERSKRIPADMFKEYSVLTAQANDAWEHAREHNDFPHFAPYLEKIVDFKRKFAEIYGYEKHPYDAMLNEFEPGLTVEKLDPIFSKLRDTSVRLLEKIKQSTYQTPAEIFNQKFGVEKQKEFNRFILPIIGFDLDAGRLDETVHPFAQSINSGDVRITTRYLEDNVRSALFGTIHEAGHGIYEQNIDSRFDGTVLAGGTSFGIHESQSRFLENMVGRSREFWKYFYPKLVEFFPEQLAGVSEVEFYRAVNTVEPSFIRIEADELTYNLHIMVRYEIEKALMAGELEVHELPAVWNKKMEEYLGIVPAFDSEGVLQDVHWSFGGIGYFPSYSLGNLYAAQILNTLKNEVPGYEAEIAKGNFAPVNDWLKNRIHQYGSLYKPDELIVRVTREELNANYLADYLNAKYTEIYKL